MHEHFLQGEDFRASVYERKIDCAEGALQLCVGKELVEYDLRISVTFEVNDNADTSVALTRMVNYVVNSFHALFDSEVINRLYELLFINHVRNFGDDNAEFARCQLLYFGFCAHDNLSATGCIRGTDS